jgi:8-oxo-dGTP pyrophosphatase MutT (NUDIX family)/phosphohistidine phosphatase SixA
MADRVTAQTDRVDALAPIRAAGGVVWRRGPVLGGHSSADRQVVVVHRPRHDDWTLPKGKLERGELPILAAVREVWEETAIRAVVGARLPTVHYEVWARGSGGASPGLADKVVDYWAMRASLDDDFTPGRETDIRAWLSVDEARNQLTYPHDLKVLTAFAELPPLRDPVIVLRHGSAGHREPNGGNDSERALDPAGVARATELVAPLRCFAPGHLIAATPRRCVQTLWPLARALDLPVETDAAFDDAADAAAAARRLQVLSAGGRSVVVCSQGKLIPAAIAELTGRAPSTFKTAKGRGWVLSFGPEGHVRVDELPA